MKKIDIMFYCFLISLILMIVMIILGDLKYLIAFGFTTIVTRIELLCCQLQEKANKEVKK